MSYHDDFDARPGLPEHAFEGFPDEAAGVIARYKYRNERAVHVLVPYEPEGLR